LRRQGPPSEIARLAAPVARVLDWAWQRMHWWVALMVVLYMFSGLTVVRSDEVAVVLRWGRLVGETPALQEHGPGLFFAFPKPIDQVVRVQVRHVWEVPVTTLTINAATYDPNDPANAKSINPTAHGYALTGDDNIVHVSMVARYRIREPAQWAFYGPKSEDVLRAEVTAAMMRSLGEMGVDRVLAEGRKDLIAIATKRAQAGLDDAHSGLELSSLELTRLSPPLSLATEFDAVQSAYIGAETKKKDAQGYAESVIPQAQGEADAAVQAAHGEASSGLATAKGEADAFHALDKEYRANPGVVRERLYRDAVEKALGGSRQVRWVPPPTGRSYNGFRITVRQGAATPSAVAATDDEAQ